MFQNKFLKKTENVLLFGHAVSVSSAKFEPFFINRIISALRNLVPVQIYFHYLVFEHLMNTF